MSIRKAILFGIVFVSLAGCEDSDARFDTGYSDGYAAGFNTACEIRATLIEGDWDDENYSRGYSDGQTAGIVDCNNSKNN